jgi:acyl-coenzyme A thioesterase PaaI-like protein
MVVLETPTIGGEPLSEQARIAFASSTSPAWCLRLLSDPTLKPFGAISRQTKPGNADSFIGETLATSDTISAWQSLYRVPLQSSSRSRADSPSLDQDRPVAGEIVNLLALGRGVNGHSNIAHGGLVGTILDDTLGSVVRLHLSPDKSAFTAFLNISFRKPLATPSTVLCRAWLERTSGERKLFLRGAIEDGEGQVFAEAEGLWVVVEREAPKL